MGKIVDVVLDLLGLKGTEDLVSSEGRFQNMTSSSRATEAKSENDAHQSKHHQSHGQHTSVDATYDGEKRPSDSQSASMETQAASVALASHLPPPTPSSYKSLEEQVSSLEKGYRELEERNRTLQHDKDACQAKVQKLKHDNKTYQSLSQQLLQKKDVYKERSKKLQRDLDDIKTFYSYIVDNYIEPYATKQNMKYNGTDADSVRSVLGSLLRDALEASPLRAQVQSLQTDMLANVDKVQAIPDEKLGLDFGTLASSIKSFSRAIKVASTINITDMEAFNQCLLLHGVRKEYWTTGSRKKGVIEAYIWSVLIQNVFWSPFSMLGPICGQLSHDFYSLFGNDAAQKWPEPGELAERWKCTTAERLQEIVGSEASLDSLPQDVSPGVIASMKELRHDVYKVIELTFAPLSPMTDFLQFNAIVDRAIKLAFQMSLQRNRIQIVWPDIGDPFVVGETKNLKSIPDSEDLEEGSVALIINPGLAKWGDAHGKSLHKRLDLVPSLVFVQPWTKDEMKATAGGVGKLIDDLDPVVMNIDELEKRADALGKEIDALSKGVDDSNTDKDVELPSGGKSLI